MPEALTDGLDIYGNSLRPTKRYPKIGRLLKTKKAKITKRTPFSVQLLYTPDIHMIQKITSGVDAGSIGQTARTKISTSIGDQTIFIYMQQIKEGN
ncbi:RRXRR domain-containing protein [Allobaculum sp. JKK-2023]|uniref:RRXRR domain-containing protein n=1 Tax=Allobaculum sp. JKK-2023 TaxID=3108943 RepID=UPI002B0540FC|nr:RRXRR domain-containing protein [Allobaculum sp. JKK-2023]